MSHVKTSLNLKPSLAVCANSPFLPQERDAARRAAAAAHAEAEALGAQLDEILGMQLSSLASTSVFLEELVSAADEDDANNRVDDPPTTLQQQSDNGGGLGAGLHQAGGRAATGTGVAGSKMEALLCEMNDVLHTALAAHGSKVTTNGRSSVDDSPIAREGDSLAAENKSSSSKGMAATPIDPAVEALRHAARATLEAVDLPLPPLTTAEMVNDALWGGNPGGFLSTPIPPSPQAAAAVWADAVGAAYHHANSDAKSVPSPPLSNAPSTQFSLPAALWTALASPAEGRVIR